MITELLTAAAPWWEQLLFATGGRLELPKIFVLPVTIYISPEGKPLLIGGDIILEIADIPLVGSEEILSLREKILSIKNGKSFEVKFLRAGVVYTKEVTKE